MGGARRSRVELVEPGPDEMPEAFAVDDADGDVGCEPREKTDQAVRCARRDCRSGDDG